MASRCGECNGIFADREDTGVCAPCQLVTIASRTRKRAGHLTLVENTQPAHQPQHTKKTAIDPEAEKRARHTALAEARRLLETTPASTTDPEPLQPPTFNLRTQ
jgi:hypothetical protein